MSLDRTSESIAHFSGLFEKTLEEARLRQDYTEFKHSRAKEAEDVMFEFGAVQNKTPYKLGEYDPGVRFIPVQPQPPLQDGQAGPAAPSAPDAPAFGGGAIELPPADEGRGTEVSGPNMMPVLPFVQIPATVVTVTLQSITLHDNDIFGDVSNLGFLPTGLLQMQLLAVTHLVKALTPWSAQSVAQEVMADPGALVAFHSKLEALENVSYSFATVASDEEVSGIRINGAVASEIPEFGDILPAYIKNKRDAAEEEEALENADHPEGHGKAEPGLFASLDAGITSYANSAHNVTTGANEAQNIVDIHTSWIDAGVIAVAGDYVSLDAISQINILSDHDYRDAVPYAGAEDTSKAYNISAVRTEEADSAPGGGSELPVVWNVVHFEGDVTVANLIKQETLVTDTDQMQLTFTANSTAIIAGENETTNLVNAAEYGAGYDLIFVSGSMTNFNMISQTNVLLDDDYFSGPGLTGATLSGADNLLHNKAEIKKQGKDTHVEVAEEFREAMKDLSKGVGDLMKTIAKSEMFAGLAALKVLQIDGNLTQLNIVDQVNLIADQDQIHMGLDAMKSPIDHVPASITAGSNLLSNNVLIDAAGYDSDVMAGGDYYDEAFLYQAELIDTGADPTGVSVHDLASEAVAFLADDMISKTVSEKLEEAGFAYDADTGGHTLDVMQSMLA